MRADLTQAAELAQLETSLAQVDDLSLLINNAGFGTSAHFAQADLSKQMAMIDLHIASSVRLCHAALPGMTARGRGAIINVSSISAYLPSLGNVTYAASKSFLCLFSQSLQLEVAKHGLKVQALCPGFTHTEFHDGIEFENFRRRDIPEALWMSADELVSASLGALSKGQVVYVPGWRNKVIVHLMRNPLTEILMMKMFQRRWRKRGKNL